MLLPDAEARAEGRAPLGLLIFLGLMTAATALTIDAVIPALDTIATDLGFEDPNDQQLLILVVFGGMGVSQLVFGPLSDAIGRKPSALIGWGVFIAGTLLGGFAWSPEAMLAGRFLQGLGAGGPRIIAMAIVRDLYSGRPMGRIMSIVMVVFMLVPMLAPLIGQGIEALGGWRAIFVLYFLVAATAAGWYLLGVPETLTAEHKKPLSVPRLKHTFGEFFSTTPSVLYTLALSCVFSAFSVYLATAQQILEEVYDLGVWFPLVFSILALAFMLANVANSRLVMLAGMRALARRAMLTLAGFGALGTLLTLPQLMGGQPPLWLFMLLCACVFACVAILFANLSSLAIDPLGHIAGTASSIVMSISTLIAFPTGSMIAQQFDGSVAPLFRGFLILGVLGIGFLLLANRARERHEAAAAA